MNKNITYGKSVPPRFQVFSKKDAGKQVRAKDLYFPGTIPANFDPKFMYNPSIDNTIFQHDPITVQRVFMVSPCPEDNISSQMFSQLNGIYNKPITAVPVNPLSKLGINMHDRLGAFGLADFSQKPFLQTSNY